MPQYLCTRCGTSWYFNEDDEGHTLKCCGTLMNLVDDFQYDKPTRIIDKEQRYTILQQQKWRCNNCGSKLKLSNNNLWEGEVAHIDHIHPFSEYRTYSGYINERNNLQALCPKCNLQKQKKRQ